MPPEGSSSANIARFLPEQALRNPDQVAVRSPIKRFGGPANRYLSRTFAQLDLECRYLIGWFALRGVEPGDRVLVMVRPGMDLIRCAFALFYLGAVPVLIDPGMGLKSFLGCVERSKPRVLLGIPLAQYVSRLFRRSFQSVEIRLEVGNREFKDVLLGDGGRVGNEPITTKSEDLAAILFTSGSTGKPKGVCYEHGMFAAQVRLLREAYQFGEGEVDLPMLPIFALFNPALGMTTVVPEMNPSRPAKVDPRKIIAAIYHWQVTNSFGSPVLWKRLTAFALSHKIQLPSLRRILIAGAPVPPQVLRDLQQVAPNATAYTPYGATECLPVSHLDSGTILNETWEQTESGRGTCVGSCFPEMEALILPIEEGVRKSFRREEAIPAGEVGEILVRGPVMTREYDGLPEETARSKSTEKETGELWHRMGDVGKLDESGRLWFCGRVVERVQLPEKTLYTDPVEAIFNTHPKVFRTALVRLTRPGGEPFAALAVEPDPGSWPWRKADRELLISELKDLGGGHPHTSGIEDFYFCRQFPVDVRHNAKIHRLTLAKRLQRFVK